MMLKSFILPDCIASEMTEYANKIIENPSRYHTIMGKKEPYGNIQVTTDPYDINYPGITDEFIMNHDLTSLKWNQYEMEGCLCSNLVHVSLPPFSVSMKLFDYLQNECGLKVIAPAGNFLYPAKTGFMGWHTNSDVPGIKICITYSTGDSSSYFKYVEMTSSGPKIITDWDNNGWTVRVFEISNDPKKYFWHCASASNSPRITFGYAV